VLIKKGTSVLTDTAFLRDGNVIKKEAKKFLNYKDLTIEMHYMWNVKTKVIPVITGATGTIIKPFRKYLSNIPGKCEIKELQKNSHIGQCTNTLDSTKVKVQDIQRGKQHYMYHIF
jgi:hypothetical protein